MQGMAGMDCNIGLRQCNCRGPVDLRALLPTWHAVPRQQSRRQHSSRHADSASLVASQQEPSRRRSVACAAASRRERLWDNVDGASTSAPLPSDPVTHEPWDVQRRGARPGVWDNGPVVDVEGLAINDSPNSSATAGQAAAATATAESQSPSVGNTAGAATGSSEASSAAASSGAAAADAAWPQVASSTDTWDEPGKAPNAWYEAGWGQPEPVYDWGADASTSAATGVPGQNGSSPGFEQQDQQGTGSRNWATHSRYEAGGMAGGGPYTEPPAGGAAGPADFFADAGQGGVGFDGSSMPSDITLLSRPDVETVLPLAPRGDQADFYQPRTIQERVVQLLGSLGASMVLSKAVALAAPALLYPVWSPWIRAGLRNLELYAKQYKCVGLWRAQVLEVEVSGFLPFPGRGGGAMVRVLVGDGWPGGARVQLEFPYQPRAELVRIGEPAELLVLCKDDAFVTFKVVREVYLPESGLWLAEYPFVDRSMFLDISLAIERSRQQQQQQRSADLHAEWGPETFE